MNKVKIGDIATVYDGPHATPKKIAQGPIYLGLDGITDDGRFNPSGLAHLSEEDYAVWTRRVTPQEDDIVFSYEATLGRYVLIPKGFYGCLGRRLGIVRCDKTKVNPRWLYYFFLSPEWTRFTQSHKVRGSTVDRLSVDDFPGYEIPLPSLDEQNRTVSAIFPIDQKIDINTRLCAELEDMAKTLYDYWFVQFDFPNENGKPYRTSGGAMDWCQELGREVPKGWRAIDILTLCDVVDCLHSKKPEYFFEYEDSYMLTLENLTKEGYIDLSEKFYISKSDYDEWVSRIEVQENDFVVTNAGRAGDIGKIPHGVKCAIGRNLTAIRPKGISAYYLREYFKSDFVKQQILSNLDSGSFFMSFNVKSIKKMMILIPDSQTLASYLQIAKPIIQRIESIIAESQQLTILRDWLLPMLMNGQAKMQHD